MQCPNCGHEARERTRFCARCGQPLPWDHAASPTPPPPPGPPAAPPSAPQQWGTPAPPPPGPTAPPGPYAPPNPYAPPGRNPYGGAHPPGASAPPNPYAPPGSSPPAGPYPPPPYGYGYGYAPSYGPARTNGLAIASLVLGLTGWALCGIGSVLAIILGFVARSQIRASGGREGGDGLARAGIILGFVFVALMVAYFIVVLIVAASRGTTSSMGA